MPTLLFVMMMMMLLVGTTTRRIWLTGMTHPPVLPFRGRRRRGRLMHSLPALLMYQSQEMVHFGVVFVHDAPAARFRACWLTRLLLLLLVLLLNWVVVIRWMVWLHWVMVLLLLLRMPVLRLVATTTLARILRRLKTEALERMPGSFFQFSARIVVLVVLWMEAAVVVLVAHHGPFARLHHRMLLLLLLLRVPMAELILVDAPVAAGGSSGVLRILLLPLRVMMLLVSTHDVLCWPKSMENIPKKILFVRCLLRCLLRVQANKYPRCHLCWRCVFFYLWYTGRC